MKDCWEKTIKEYQRPIVISESGLEVLDNPSGFNFLGGITVVDNLDGTVDIDVNSGTDGYWKNDGTSTATGDWSIYPYAFTAGPITARNSGFFAYSKIISRPDMFSGVGYGNEAFTIDNYGSIYNPDGIIECGRSIYAGTDITAENDIYAGNTVTGAYNVIAGDVNGSYYWAEGGYSEIFGKDGVNSVTDFWNDNGGDAAFGLRYADNMFMFGTDYQLIGELGINMNLSKEFGIGVLPESGTKVRIDGDVSVSGAFQNSTTDGDIYYKQQSTVAIDKGHVFTYFNGLTESTLLELKGGGADFQGLDIATTGDITATKFISTATSGNMLECAAGNNDVNIWQVGNTPGAYGFYLKYMGTGAGDNNTLELWADNQDSADARVYEVKQSGNISFDQAVNVVGLTTLTGGMGGDIDMNTNDILEVGDLQFDANYIHIVTEDLNTTRIAIGGSTTAAAYDYLTNIGYGNTGIDRSVVIGTVCNNAANYVVSLGYDADSGGARAVSIGYATDATYESNIAIGDAAQATGNNNAIAIGSCTASGNKAIAIGELAETTQTSSVAMGYGAKATGGYGCCALGPNAKANGGSSFAMGYLSESAAYGIGLGAGAKSTQNHALAMGYQALASGYRSVAIGAGTTTYDGPIASGNNSIAIGGYDSVTAVDGPLASAANSVAIGAGCSNAVANEMKVGGNVTSTYLDGILRVDDYIKLEGQTLLATPVAGAIEYDGSIMHVTNDGVQRPIDRSTVLVNSTVTVADTTTETTVLTSTMPANSLAAEQMMKLLAWGDVSTNSAADSVTVRFKVGGVTKKTFTMTPKALSAEHFDLHAVATQRTLGATGSRASHTHMEIGDESTVSNGVGTIDTTADMSLTVTVQWNNADPDNIFNLYQGVMEFRGGGA